MTVIQGPFSMPSIVGFRLFAICYLPLDKKQSKGLVCMTSSMSAYIWWEFKGPKGPKGRRPKPDIRSVAVAFRSSTIRYHYGPCRGRHGVLVCMRARASFVKLKYPTLGSPFRHSLRAICAVLLDPRDPLVQSDRTQGFAADPVYGRAKCLPMLGEIKT